MTYIKPPAPASSHTVLWRSRRTRTRVPEASAAAAAPLLPEDRATGEQGRLRAMAASCGRSRPAPRSSTASARAAARWRRASRHDGDGVASALLHRAHHC